MLCIFLPEINPRLEYVMRLFWGRLCRTEYFLTTDWSSFLQYEGAKFAYGKEDNPNFPCFPTIIPNPLLEKDVHPWIIEEVPWQNWRLFFPVNSSLLPFDPFAVVFYLVTRYEEYLPTELDEHKRFCAKNSLSYRLGFHRFPMVNKIAETVAEIIIRYFPKWHYHHLSFSNLPTFDVDIAYKYRGKTPLRFCGSLVKSVIKGDFVSSKRLCETLFLKSNNIVDEYDTFKKHKCIAKHMKATPIHFLLTAPWGKFDRNISYHSSSFCRLVEELKEFSFIGIHPSYFSSDHPSMIAQEKARLEDIAKMPITKSRQHFLRFYFPDTFRALVNCGITDDYSLGWHDEVGFRASITSPFYFFDLLKNEETPLLLHPLHLMDGAIFRCEEEQNFSSVISKLQNEVVKYGGEFVTLQHNSAERKIDLLQQS